MKYLRIFAAIILLGATSMGYSAAIPSAQLTRINSFVIVDNEGEQYIAATGQGLFHSADQGHTWAVYEGSFRLHQESLEQARTRLPESKIHAVPAITAITAITAISINFNAAEIVTIQLTSDLLDSGVKSAHIHLYTARFIPLEPIRGNLNSYG